jgi:O-antigen/teichoic acid export membrane protein
MMIIFGVSLYIILGLTVFTLFYDEDDRGAAALIAICWPIALLFSVGVLCSGLIALGAHSFHPRERPRQHNDDELE